jgi:hypothetical protein
VKTYNDNIEHDRSIKENDTKEVWKKLKILEHDLHVNNISDKKSACFWCTYEFDNPPVYIPKHFINKIEKIKVYASMQIPYNFQPKTKFINEEGLNFILIKSNKKIAKDWKVYIRSRK